MMNRFDLKRALAGEPVVTRSGMKVDNLHCANEGHFVFPLVGTVEGEDRWDAWTMEGRIIETPLCEHRYDLFMVHPKAAGVTTRDGQAVEQLIRLDVSGRNMVGRIANKIYMWYSDGRFSRSRETTLDLMLGEK